MNLHLECYKDSNDDLRLYGFLLFSYLYTLFLTYELNCDDLFALDDVIHFYLKYALRLI